MTLYGTAAAGVGSVVVFAPPLRAFFDYDAVGERFGLTRLNLFAGYFVLLAFWVLFRPRVLHGAGRSRRNSPCAWRGCC